VALRIVTVRKKQVKAAEAAFTEVIYYAFVTADHMTYVTAVVPH
jgi:hypothetical protein